MELTQQIFDKIKSMPHKTGAEVSKITGVSQATVSRARSSVTLAEAKAKGRHKTAEDRKNEVQKDILKLMKKMPKHKTEEFKTEDDIANHITEERRKKEEWRQKPSIVRTTENKKSVIKTTIIGGEAKIEIIPKRSLLSRIFRRGK